MKVHVAEDAVLGDMETDARPPRGSRADLDVDIHHG